MSRTKIGTYGTFTSTQAGVWVSASGQTTIEQNRELGSAIGGATWWVIEANWDFIAVFHTLREALEMRWD